MCECLLADLTAQVRVFFSPSPFPPNSNFESPQPPEIPSLSPIPMDPTSTATGPHQNPTTRPKPKRASYAGTRTAAKSKRQGGANPSRVIYKSTPAAEEEASEDERAVKKWRRVEGCEWSELARAVLRFAEVYERVENSRQAWMVELEKERLEIAREVEFERMNLLVDAQLEIARRAAARVVHENP